MFEVKNGKIVFNGTNGMSDNIIVSSNLIPQRLNISSKPKTKEEYIKESQEYYKEYFENNDVIIKEYTKYNLDSELTMANIRDYYKYLYDNLNLESTNITNIDNVEYTESFVHNTLFYVRNSNENEAYYYYHRLLFMETWKWNYIKTMRSVDDIIKFTKSADYRKWKISKVLGDI